MSAVETCVSTAAGMGLAYLTQIVVFPLLGIDIPSSQHGLLVLVFTGVSLVRGFCVRRIFEGLRAHDVKRAEA